MEAISGYDPDDPNSARVPAEAYARRLYVGIDGLRIGVPAGRFAEAPVPSVRAAFDVALAVLSGAGAEVVPVVIDLPDDDLAVSLALCAVEAKHYHAPYLERIGEYGPDVRRRLEMANGQAEAIGAAIQASNSIRREFQRALTNVDILATPTTPFSAPPISDEEFICEGRAFTHRDLSLLTAPMNHARLPALTVPCGLPDGLPVGLTFTGSQFDEGTVLRAGYAYQRATPWHRASPPSLASAA
jgi:aspartyl-tRNA(Asn)/glutamyl-tRNA(Gln) amidotransferase subunit A